MVTLTKAHEELFKRGPDESFESFDDLCRHCTLERDFSNDIWERPQDVTLSHDLTLCTREGAEYQLNDWSFSQVCRMAGVSKDTINRLSRETASRALKETLPRSQNRCKFWRPATRSAAFTGWPTPGFGMRICWMWSRSLRPTFRRPKKQRTAKARGFYCGEQDMFAFMIDPTGWAKIDGQFFAPGFFVWNSEVGRRSLGIQTFWFQKVCANHLVWDATEVVEFSRKHTANVREGLNEVRSIIESLVARRNERRDSFAAVIRKAMVERLGKRCRGGHQRTHSSQDSPAHDQESPGNCG